MTHLTIPIIYEDRYLLIIDKPAGAIVHEGAGQEDGNTILLTTWLKQERPDIVTAFANDPDPLYFRPGIVHRLDKDTSGLLVIAKTPEIKAKLQALFKSRQVTKQYTTLVLGRPNPEEGTITTFISRNPQHRREMAVSFVGKGKEAVTEYKLVSDWPYRYKGQTLPISLLDITLHSGRMHQIRVHLKHKGWPVIGDQTYYTKPSRNISKDLGLDRQFLHAQRLAFIHPELGELVDTFSPLPEDLQPVIDKLETDNAHRQI
jgi:23S rRNA pseudouridine1911/1915/1917 synthase